MTDKDLRQQALGDALRSRVVVIDGAMGTVLQQRDLTAADFGGADLEGCNENLVLTRPDVVLDVHRAYYQAGADIVETDTFGGASIVLAEYGLAEKSFEINRQAAELARQAAAEFDAPGRLRFVAGSMGPTTKAITVTGGITFPELIETFYVQAKGLIAGGADVLLIETCQDTRNTKAALLAVARLRKELGIKIPVMVSGTIEPMGTMLAGQTAEALWTSIEHADLLSVGLNCATGPEFMTDHMRTLHEMATVPLLMLSERRAAERRRKLRRDATIARRPARKVRRSRVAEPGWRVLRHDSGLHPADRSNGGRKRPRAPREPAHRAYYSGIDFVEANEDNRPLIVGERTNVIGSRLFKRLVSEEQWEEASDIARRQVRNGAHIIDVCLQSSDRDELADIPPFYDHLIRKTKAPLMIDTTDPAAIELALQYCQGKAIVNSVNLEDGEEKFERICPLVKLYGAALVVGCIDEDPVQAQAFTRERKLAVAERSVELLTGKYGIPPEDLIIDPLVFPCATGDENYIGGAAETIAAVRLVKEKLPYVKTILGSRTSPSDCRRRPGRW